MATRVVGKLDDWGDADFGGGSDFMRLEEGSNVVRVLTSPYQFYSHWAKDAAGANRKVKCALEDCPLCQMGEKATARWYVGVLNKKLNKTMILEIGTQILGQIVGLKKKASWGDPRKYDIDIERKPKGAQPLYVICPEEKGPLSEEHKAMAQEFVEKSKDIFEALVASPTPDEIREKMGLMPVKSPEVDSDFGEDDGLSDSDDDFDFGD